MIRSLRAAFGVAAAFCTLAMVATADDKKAPKGDKPFDDAEFVMKASEGGLYEVEAHKLATKMAKNEDVKKHATMMLKDHTKLNAEMKKVATAGGMKVATKLDAKHAKTIETLKGLKGAEFDKAYLADQVEDHEADIKEFTTASEKAKAPALKELATKALPTLKEHLEMVKKAQDEKSDKK